MSKLKQKLLEKLLGKMAGAVLARRKPQVVGITGSIGKSTTKEMVASLLEDFFRTGKTEKNYNTEIGVPLAICAGRPPQNLFGWPVIFWLWLKNLFFRRDYPEVLVLEMAADKKGDIKYLSRLTSPAVGVVTNIGISHLEKFKTVKNLIKEKSELFSALPVGGWAVFNFDDPECRKMAEKAKAETIGYGFEDGATVRATDIYVIYQEVDRREYGLDKIPCGMGFKISYQGKILPVRLNGSFGLPAVYGALAAFSTGLYFQLNPIKMVASLEKPLALEGRLGLKRGIKNSLIIDDCYNSAPDSLRAALEIFSEMKADRKIAVLGDMLELGSEEDASHRKVGRWLAERKTDFFLAVGERMKVAVEEYRRLKQDHNLSSAWFASSEEAATNLQSLVRPGDLILIKGSRGIKMEKIVGEIKRMPVGGAD